MKDELLFAILFFGFLRFPASLVVPSSEVFPSPNAGAEPTESAIFALSATDPSPSLLPGASAELLLSFGCS